MAVLEHMGGFLTLTHSQLCITDAVQNNGQTHTRHVGGL